MELVHSEQICTLAKPKTACEAIVSGQLSRNTARAYARDISDFLNFIGGEQHLPEVTKDVIISFRTHLIESEGQKPATVNRKLSAVRQLFEEAVDRRQIPANPTRRVKGLKQDYSYSPTIGLTRDEARTVLRSVECETLLGKRNFALLSLMIRTGLRRGEIALLHQCDVGERDGHRVLTVTGKGNKRRLVKLPADVWRAIEAWLEAAGIADTESPLFAEVRKIGRGENATYRASRGKPLTGDGIWYVVRRRIREAGITANVTPHSLRHTFVTLALAGGAPLHKVQYAAGHADPRTTERYDRERENLDDNAVDYVRL